MDELTISEWALREGIVLDAIGRHDPVDLTDDPRAIRRASVQALARRFSWPEAHSRQVAKLSLELFDQTRELHGLDDNDRELLEYAALLHDIGEHVSHDGHDRHAAYLVAHGQLRGFDPEEILVLTALVRWHRRGEPKASDDLVGELDDRPRDRVRRLAAIIRIADGLDRSRKQVVTGDHGAGQPVTRAAPPADRGRSRARALGRPPQARALREGLRPRARAHRPPERLTGDSSAHGPARPVTVWKTIRARGLDDVGARWRRTASRSTWNAAMRSIIATSAAAAAYGASPATAFSATLRDRPFGDRLQRRVAHVAEPLVAFLRREVAGAQDRAVVVPVAGGSRRPAAGRDSSPASPRPRRVEQLDERRGLLPDRLGQREHRLLDVAEVLVEGRRRRARPRGRCRRRAGRAGRCSRAARRSRRAAGARVAAPRLPSARPSSALAARSPPPRSLQGI